MKTKPRSGLDLIPISQHATPLTVPFRLTPEAGKNAFDHSNTSVANAADPFRVFIVPMGTLLRPDDQNDPARRRYSFTWADWHHGVLSPAEVAAWRDRKLYQVWDRILAYSRKQAGMHNPGLQKGNAKYHLNFYQFVEPEIHVVEIDGKPPTKPYTLHWSDRGNCYFYTRLQKRGA